MYKYTEYFLEILKYKKKIQTDNYNFILFLSLIFSTKNDMNFKILNENY